MADAESSAIAVFAAELRAQRTRLGWTQVTLGDKTGYSGSFISDIERAERTPSLDLARACDREMGLPGTFERLHELTRRAAYPSWFYPVIPLETTADRITEWELRVVPGLLQTEDYARAVIRADKPRDSEESVAGAVTARLDRQDLLTRDQPPMLWYILDEAILRRLVGGPSVMDAQLARLADLASRPGVVIQVLPFSARIHAGSNGPIMIFEFADAPTTCYTECYGGGRIVEARDEVARLMTVINMVRASALPPEESAELMQQIRSEIAP
jgi:transcriptional regulator with XRE-family HTH domain